MAYEILNQEPLKVTLISLLETVQLKIIYVNLRSFSFFQPGDYSKAKINLTNNNLTQLSYHVFYDVLKSMLRAADNNESGILLQNSNLYLNYWSTYLNY